MGREIERKFLVEGDGWRADVVRSVHLTDGLILAESGAKARVRIADERASIALKSKRTGLARQEFEYETPLADAEEMLKTMCQGRILEKTRHIVLRPPLTWEIDVYEGPLAGLIIAEVELTREDQSIDLPPWIGREVTHDPLYRKARMQAAGRRPAA